jgi:hypothetical protein
VLSFLTAKSVVGSLRKGLSLELAAEVIFKVANPSAVGSANPPTSANITKTLPTIFFLIIMKDQSSRFI